MKIHDMVEKANQPQVSVPTTVTAATVGMLSASEWLTLLSICVVVMQLIIALPKFLATLRSFAGWLRQKFGGKDGASGKAKPAAAVGMLIAGLAAAGIGLALPNTSGFEGREYVAYRDIGGVWTACDGATKGIKLDYVYTDAECDAKTAADLQHAAAVVQRYVIPEIAAAMPATRWAAFIDWVYNLGEGNFKRSTMLKKLNAGDVIGACTAIMDWMYVAGKDCRLKESKCGGIPKRRAWEMDMCLQPAPEPEAPPRPWWKFWEVS